ncbi:hypothetical protein AB0M36_36460 [Actinoplanes sp. NPDC051346]|uniref:hypothetical protein n=1 Tax=Actinoplanes sp. NPDC051346 TaxID=3155048 RepID=UPI003430329B
MTGIRFTGRRPARLLLAAATVAGIALAGATSAPADSEELAGRGRGLRPVDTTLLVQYGNVVLPQDIVDLRKTAP